MSQLPPYEYEKFARHHQDRFNRIIDLLLALTVFNTIDISYFTYRKILNELSDLERLAAEFGLKQVPELSPAEQQIFAVALAALVRKQFSLRIISLATTFRSGRIPAPFSPGRGIRLTSELDDQSRLKLTEAVRKGAVVTLNGPRYQKYAPDYFVSLIVHSEVGKTLKEQTLKDATSSGSDLVQISPQPSTIGDYCDLYRGRVFSISGTHPDFPPLTECPAGGAPFHPWCRHTLSAVEDGSTVTEAAKKLPPIPQEFISAARANASPAEFMKLWRAHNRSNSP